MGPRSWQTIADSDDQAGAVRAHLGFLADSDECLRLLDELMVAFVEARLGRGTGALDLVFRSQYGKDCVIKCGPPYEGDVSAVAPSVARVLRVHNSIAWAALGGGWFGFTGCDAFGRFVGSGGWEWEALLDASEENEKFLQQLADGGFDADDVPGAFDFGQNWAIWHPAETNALGEPRLYFVSHGDCLATPVESADAWGFGPVLLRVMARYILGSDLLPEMYS